MRTLPIRTIPGIGRVQERVLKSMGVDVRVWELTVNVYANSVCWNQTCGDIFTQRAVINAMDKYLGLRSLL
jgi:hypothetical protein